MEYINPISLICRAINFMGRCGTQVLVRQDAVLVSPHDKVLAQIF